MVNHELWEMTLNFQVAEVAELFKSGQNKIKYPKRNFPNLIVNVF